MAQPTDPNEQGLAAATTSVANELKFETALAELEQIVRNMEAGRLPLEESIAAYRRGSALLKHCQQQLADAERKIQVLESGVLRDFDAPEAETPASRGETP